LKGKKRLRSRKPKLTAVGIRCADHATLYLLKLALTSPTSGGRSVGIVRWRTKAPEFFLPFLIVQLSNTLFNIILPGSPQSSTRL
jgi:hypothetical protein